MSSIATDGTDIQFESPANRIISQFAPKNKFKIDTSLPDLAFLRQMSVQGRLRYTNGSGATAITLTPNTGETFFIYRIYFNNDQALAAIYTIENDGQSRLTSTVPVVGVANPFEINFFDSIVGNSKRSFTITANRASASATAFFWVENTSRIRDVAP